MTDNPGSNQPVQPRKHKQLTRQIAIWSRWLHIYLSMFGFAVILFFSITGFTLNHPDWFFRETTRHDEGTLERKWLDNDSPPPENWDQNDYGHKVSKLEIAEYLRKTHRLTGSVTDFLCFEDECQVTFTGPGYAANVRIARESGTYTVDIITNDLVSILNDLHKGRHTGETWSWVIDISAILSTMIALTGFVLIFFLKLKRFSGIMVSALGTIVLVFLSYLAML